MKRPVLDLSSAFGMTPRIEDLRILVVEAEAVEDDSIGNVLTEAGFANVEVAPDTDDALARSANAPPALVLLDLDLPECPVETLGRLSPRAVPVIVAGGGADDERWRCALRSGARDHVRKPIESTEVLTRVRTHLELMVLRAAEEQRERDEAGRERVRAAELDAARLEVVERLARAGEFRDDETGEHTRRVGATARALANAADLDPATARAIGLAAPLHDIGKIAIPDSILLRRGGLTDQEILVMQRHTVIGAEMLDGSSSRLLNLARDIALSHHERWDGHGYPRGSSGQDIPLAGRIVALADVFDALTHERPYKEAWSVNAAVEEVAAQAGRQFDPGLVRAFLTLSHGTLI